MRDQHYFLERRQVADLLPHVNNLVSLSTAQMQVSSVFLSHQIHHVFALFILRDIPLPNAHQDDFHPVSFPSLSYSIPLFGAEARSCSAF